VEAGNYALLAPCLTTKLWLNTAEASSLNILSDDTRKNQLFVLFLLPPECKLPPVLRNPSATCFEKPRVLTLNSNLVVNILSERCCTTLMGWWPTTPGSLLNTNVRLRNFSLNHVLRCPNNGNRPKHNVRALTRT